MFQTVKRYRSLIASSVIFAAALVSSALGTIELANSHLQEFLFNLWIAFALGGLAFEPKVILLSLPQFISHGSRSRYSPGLYSLSALFFILWSCCAWSL
jgi:hypothetical protein